MLFKRLFLDARCWVLAGLLGVSQSTSASDGKFVNLSTRALVETGEEVMIGGFIIEDGAKQVLIQALGRELTDRGISNVLPDPVLTVIQTSEGEPPRTILDPPVEIMVNDNWEDSQSQLVTDLWGGSPNLTTGSLSSAAVLTLDPGNYTAKVEGKNGSVGVALVEVYGVDSPGAESGVTRLRKEGSSFAPAWSPDGTRIAFSGRSPLANNSDIYVMNVDGSGVTNLTNNSELLQKNPVWSPDGARIAFLTRTSQVIGPDPYEIYVMNADGSDMTQLTNQSVWDDAPTWSPDGTNIAFSVSGLTSSAFGNYSDIYLINVDGSGVTNLTNNPDLGQRDPAWSPDGTKIAFSSPSPFGNYSDIFVMNPDGSGVRQFTNNVSSDMDPAWSPDGTRIAFSGHSPVGNYSDIYVMNADGSGMTNLTNHPAVDMDPAWSPDGTRIAFSSFRDDPLSPSLYVLEVSQPTSEAEGKFVNLSTRALVETGDDVMIGGLIIREGARQVLIQALGPELADSGISNALADPVLTITNTTDAANPMELMVNDNWEDSQRQLVLDLWGGNPNLAAGSLSSAAVLTLDPGNYTAKVEGKEGTAGVALVEVYGIDSPDTVEREALAALYNAMDGANWRSSYNWGTAAPLDQWYGVQVDPNGHVIGLNLQDNQLSGPIPVELGQLTKLRTLSLSDNELIGPIPAELGQLSDLELLQLDSNDLSGPIPAELGQLSNLRFLYLQENQLSGEMPAELGQLTNLRELHLGNNQLSGPIPVELVNLPLIAFSYSVTNLCLPANAELEAWVNGIQSHIGTRRYCRDLDALMALYNSTDGSNWAWSDYWGTDAPLNQWYGVGVDGEGRVIELSLSRNQLSGPIPPELGNLNYLRTLNLSINPLSGKIPPELGNLDNLEVLDFLASQLSGEIPPELSKLSKLQFLKLSDNELSGPIPPELGNLHNLRWLDLGINQLSGPVPPDLGNLHNLEELKLKSNELSGPIPEKLGDLDNLEELNLTGNKLSGPIPPELGNLANLLSLDLINNQLSGEIPPELGNLQNLRWLDLSINQLSGEIPEELGSLVSLRALALSDNQLSGRIPKELGNLENLDGLWVRDNQLNGPIPATLGNLANMERLYLRGNQLSGPIPAVLGNFENIQHMDLSANQLSGPIPPELSNLRWKVQSIYTLSSLDLSDNQLSGTIPPELGDLNTLVRLDLSANQLSGQIPPELINLESVGRLDLSSNQLSGPIPPELGNLAYLQELNLSENQLSGTIPAQLGNLANLRELFLSNNQLSGSISDKLLELNNLEIFQFEDNDGLCAPNTDAFTSWLMGIAEWSGPRCALNQPPLTVSTIPGQTLVEAAGPTTIRVGTAFSDPDSDALTFSSVAADEKVVRIGMSGVTLSVTPVAEGTTTVSVTAADAEGLEASLTFPVTVERLAPRPHNVTLRVVHVTTDWMPYASWGGWPDAAQPKESSALKYFEAAIWDETESVHLYEFDNNFDPHHDAGTDSARIAYREQFVVRKHTGMPTDWVVRQDFVKSAFVDFARYIVERFPDSDHHLLYSGHGGPGGRLFAGLLSRKGAAEFLETWREALGRRLGVIDMGGPCNKGGLSDLENFCAHARYYIASDLPNGGYTMDNWTIEKWNEVNVERQYHSLFDTHGTLEEALVARIELKRKRYEYSRQDMIANKVEQGNYLYSCTNTMAEFGWNARLFIEQSGGSYDYGRDLWNYLTDNNAPKPLLEMFDQTIIHDANNRDFFSWEAVANGIMMCCR